MEQKEFDIRGMTCTACARAVERASKNIDGVNDANVNFATEKLNIKFENSKVTEADIKNAVKKAGYTALNEEESARLGEFEKEKEIKDIKKRLIISASFAIPLLIISMGSMILESLGVMLPKTFDPMIHKKIFSLIQFVLVLPVIAAGRKYYSVGFRTLVKGSPNMDSLIAIGSGAAFIYSLFSMFLTLKTNTMHHMYFESAGMILTLVTLGKYFESLSKGKTSESIKKLMGLAPKTAVVIRDGKEIEVDIKNVKVGDIVMVKPGEKLPADGKVIEGFTSIDESMLTGESMPVDKKIGDDVVGASINKNGIIKYKVTKVGKDTALSQIIKLVEEAQNSKAPIAKLADVISGYFVPTVIILAIVSSIVWKVSGQSLTFSLTIFISVLVIACPCALGLATPTAIMVGTGKGAEYGILIKSGIALENAHKIKTVVFDKTGTITEGKPEVMDILAVKGVDKNYMLQMAASAEKMSEHPLGKAIVKKAEEMNIDLKSVKEFTAVPGYGIKGIIDNHKFIIGNRKFMEQNNISLERTDEISLKLSESSKTPMYVSIDNNIAGIISVADKVKKNSKKAVKMLHDMGIQVTMITGDNSKTAQTIADEVGIDKVFSGVLPKGKSEEIKKLQKDGNKVAMVGDGINDAPALAQADIGIAVGSGTDVAIESADIVLMKNDIVDVSNAIMLSKKTITNIKQNLFWAFGYNVIGIPVAMGVLHIFGGPLLNPIIAALAMSFSSVSVVTNALRLRSFKPLT